MRCKILCGVVLLMLAAVSVQGCSKHKPVAVERNGECVILLHGLARGPSSMEKIGTFLLKKGYKVINSGYPSTRATVEHLAESYIPPMIEHCDPSGSEKIHFVTHSMGGILIRQFLQAHKLPAGSRVVMISPPNQGSSLVNVFGGWFFFNWIYGPAGKTLGTGPESLPNRLEPVGAEIGVITGSRSFNPLCSWIIEGDDDGRVAVQKAKLEEMEDFLVLPHTHTFIMKSDAVCRQVSAFLANGRFDRDRLSSEGDIE